MLRKSFIVSAIGFLVLFSLLFSASASEAGHKKPHHADKNVEEVTLDSDHSQVYFLAKNIAVDFSVECDGCDVLVSSQVEQVIAAEPYEYDRKLSSLKVAGLFLRNNVKSNEDRVLVLRNPSPHAMKIKYAVAATDAAHKKHDKNHDEKTLYIVGFVVGIIAVFSLVLVLLTYNRSRRVARSNTIIPETMSAPRISYGTYTPALSSVVTTVPQAASSRGSVAVQPTTTEASPVAPPVYFLYPVPPRYPGVSQLNAAGQAVHFDASAITTTTAAPATGSSIYPTLHPAATQQQHSGRRANPI